MPILHKVGRKHIGVRILIGAIYLFLCAGAVTMLYPFGLMLGGSTKSTVDQKELRIIPGFLTDGTRLYRKYIEGLFNEKLDMVKAAYDEDTISFESIDPPPAVNERLLGEYTAFLETLEGEYYTYTAGFMRAETTRELIPRVLREFIRELKTEYGGDLDAANRALGTTYASWQSVFVMPMVPLEQVQRISNEPLMVKFREVQRRQPHLFRYYFGVQGYYRNLFLKPQYSGDIAFYNEKHGTGHASYHDVRLTRRAPAEASPVRKDWEWFVRVALNLLWVRADETAAPAYREFLQGKYRSIDALNRVYGTAYPRFEEIPLFDDPLREGIAQADWAAFVRGWKDLESGQTYQLPLDAIYIDSLEFRFRDFLRDRHPSLGALNKALGTDYASFADISLPQKQLHYREFLAHRGSLRLEFLTRNYRSVIAFLLLNGRALFNTVVYCSLAVLSALIVNPMAAYALSRYRLPSTYKILLFLMVTMAFPPMVTQIPVFLTLRNLNLLNTFWALILPVLANGYLIFILKGFFDSQPRELFECASLDGANEWILFWQITMNLSKPVLAYIALMAFTQAYSNFMFALLICQDEKMWTLMPTLYQLQLRSHMGITLASLIIAAIPTFLVFLFAQNIIMRGIVVPVEK